MFILYLDINHGHHDIERYSVCLDLDWLENHIAKSWIDMDSFLKNYNSSDVFEIVDAMDAEGVPYTIQEEHQFSGFAE